MGRHSRQEEQSTQREENGVCEETGLSVRTYLLKVVKTEPGLGWDGAAPSTGGLGTAGN